MRHRNRGRKLGVNKDHRKAMLRQLVEALFLHGRIRTTLTRAKETRRIAERVITWAKKGTLHHRRLAFAVVYRQDVINRVFDQVVEWYRNRPGGYTRIIKIGPRPGDGAPTAFLELVDWISGEKLTGQHLKQVKKPEGEEGTEGKDEKGKKEKKGKEAKAKPAPKPEKKAVAKNPEKEKKKAERQAAQQKLKQEKAAAREKAGKEKAEAKTQSKSKPTKGSTKQK
jgi:large subunit ribosomal protein L17